MSNLKMLVLGSCQVALDDKPVEISSRKALALLAYLAVYHKPFSRDALSALLWPDYGQSQSRAYLRHALWSIKSALGESWLDASREVVALQQTENLWLDKDRFEHLIETSQGHQHNPNTPCSACKDRLVEAIDLYQGDFLAGFTLPDAPMFDDWEFFTQEALRQKYAWALKQLAGEFIHQQDYEHAIPYVRRWVAQDNYHEAAHRELIKLYALSGQQAAAIRQYNELVRTLKGELDMEPEEATTALYDSIRSRQYAIKDTAGFEVDLTTQMTGLLEDGQQAVPERHDAGHSRPRPLYNIPHPVSPLVGRDEEITAIVRLLKDEPDHRLLNLTGPGGCGKTRLALEAALRLVEIDETPFTDGVYFIPLAPYDNPSMVEMAVAKAVQFSIYREAEEPRRHLLEYLNPKHMLLVLDNIEHLIAEESLCLLAEILADSPNVKLLVTSRNHLNIRGEKLFPISGLRVPTPNPLDQWHDPESALIDYSAVRLFKQCAERSQPGFQLTSENIQTVIRVCQLVEGMPLGIELATTWLEMLSVEEIAAEIERSLDFLAVDWVDIPERQRSLRAVFESTWMLLDEQERDVFKKLSVFNGHFSREAAMAVSGASLKTLLALVHKSCLSRSNGSRFYLHDLLRQYAAEKLQDSEADFNEARDDHASYYAQFLQALLVFMRGTDQKKAFDAVTEELDNIRSAWHWYLLTERMDAVVHHFLPALYMFAEAPTKVSEFMFLLETAISTTRGLESEPQIAEVRKILLTADAAFIPNEYPLRFYTFGLTQRAKETSAREAWMLPFDLTASPRTFLWEIVLAFVYGRIIDQEAGLNRIRHLVGLAERRGLLWEKAYALESWGRLLLNRISSLVENDSEAQYTARTCLAEAQMIFRDLGDERETAWTLQCLGVLALHENDLHRAVQDLQLAQTILRAVGEWGIAAEISLDLASAYLRLGDPERAFACLQEMSSIFLLHGYERDAAYAISRESIEALRYSSIDHARRTRQESLRIFQKYGDRTGQAWSNWEMGEILRVDGNLTEAQRSYEQAKVLFDQIQDPNADIFVHRALGDIAHAKGDFQEAGQQFRDSLKNAQEKGHVWGMSYAHSGLGRAALAQDQRSNAREQYNLGLELARKLADPGLALVALDGIARLLYLDGDEQSGLALSAYVANHSFSWLETRRQAGDFLTNQAAAVDGIIRSSSSAAAGKDLWDVSGQVLSQRFTTIV